MPTDNTEDYLDYLDEDPEPDEKPAKRTSVDSPKELWLAPDCDGGEWCEHGCEGREWCQDPVYDTCPECGSEPVKYLRADIAEDRIRKLEQALSALIKSPGTSISEERDRAIAVLLHKGGTDD